jgi:resuscitation-promoting factor RpfB
MTRPNLDAALVAAAIFGVGVACGSAMVTVIGPESTPAATVTATPLPAVTVTAPARASRSHSRGTSPAILPSTTSKTEGTRGGLPGGASRVSGPYQHYARALVDADQWPCLRKLWQRESNWNPKADNPRSSAYGIPQMLRMKPGTPWRTQITRGLGYIDRRYGTPCRALSHSNSKGWY